MSAVLETPPLQLRPMTEADLNTVMDIEQIAYPYPWTRRIFADCLRVGYRCLVAELDDVFVGYGVMSIGAGEAHVLNLCVAETFRRRGLGRSLLEGLLDAAAELEVENVFLEVRPSNISALQLYDQMGFNPIGTRKDYYPADHGREDAVILAICLLAWQ
ncbi:MAG: ribosomal protein S18-alanine N-acetyltransferase [Gammaproteobacteria bacterium]|nr:ribosomal protein S18-alanine N-acetyltransferase [Gammaproteobacteria bacterium]